MPTAITIFITYSRKGLRIHLRKGALKVKNHRADAGQREAAWGVREAQGQFASVQLLRCCVALAKSPNLSDLQFPCASNGARNRHPSGLS